MSRAKLALGVPLAMAADQALSAMLRRTRPRVARAGFVERPEFDIVEDLEPYLIEQEAALIVSWLRFWEA